jgi:ATP-dependent exoDNAse (exonuclease V) beta subunit
MIFNETQLQAIEHKGGLSLSAGAGSGKTTVIIGHIIHKIQCYLDTKGALLAPIELSDFLKRIVVMTYTKKAAAELETRLKKEIYKRIDNEKWKMVEKLSSHIYVGTIHGFCSKLLKEYGNSLISPNFEIISELEKNIIIEKKIEKWMEDNRHHIDDFSFFSVNFGVLNGIMKKVFEDAGLRLRWRNYQHETDSTKEFISNLFSILPIFKKVIDIKCADLPSSDDGLWFVGLKKVLNIISSFDHDLTGLLELMTAIKELNFRSSPNKNNFPGCSADYKLLKYFRDDFISTYFDAIYSHLNTSQESRNSWDLNLKQLFNQLDLELCKESSITYADLEFYSHLLLKDENSREKISQNYDYFIVDEFQDTSILQLEIIEWLIKGNFKKLFVVGDLKQAIYGFRGGKTSVFEHVIKNTELLELNHNYRSVQKIVTFNNNLFSSVLNLGVEYSGVARNKIRVTDQILMPEKINNSGGVYCLQTTTSEELTRASAKILEARLLVEKIKEIRKKNPEEDIVILYKNLNPSVELIKQLKANNIGFRSQIKINRTEDPVWAMFELFISLYANEDEQKFYVLTHILKHLEVKNVPKINKLEVMYFGPYQAFINFLQASGLAISNYKTNLEHIEKIIETTGENINEIIRYLESYFEFKDSSFIEQGDHSHLVTIMTVHASKGLEFDHVLIGGISANASKNAKENNIGCWPGSYKWKKSYKESKSIPSLSLILELIEKEIEDSAEMKRLLYVACTRAKKYLFWPELTGAKGKVFSYGPESWVNALTKSKENEIINLNHFTDEVSEFPEFKIDKVLIAPNYQENWVGVYPLEGGRSTEIYSELSVTNFLVINECPRKFYFKNICKLDEKSRLFFESEDELHFTSSMDRGSKLHKDIENYVKRDDAIKGLDNIKKIIDERKSNFNLHSEYSMKFNIPNKNFGQMVSGTIDLLLVPEKSDGCFEVWDFKTGQRKIDETQYFSQLLMYSYAVFEQFNIDQNSQMILKIIYLDTNEIIEKRVKRSEVKEYVVGLWSKTHHLTQINPNHCNYCDYQSICTKN